MEGIPPLKHSGNTTSLVLTTYKPFTVSNDLLDEPIALRERLAADGYLFLKQVIDRKKLQSLRLDILHIFQDKGWLKQGYPMIDGITDTVPTVEGEDAFFDVYD